NLLAVRGRELADRHSQFGFDPVRPVTLVQLPGQPSQSTLRQYQPEYVGADFERQDSAPAVNWTLVAGMIALAVVGVVISGAFAVGARRQLVTLGQLSANGAGEPLLRRMLSLQGSWCGAFGTALGLGAGVVTLVLMHDRFNQWIHRDIGSYIWSPRNL